MYSLHKSIPPLLLLPFIFSVLYLVANLLCLVNENVASILETIPFPVFTLTLTIVLVVAEIKYPSVPGLRAKTVYAIPGFMAPTALFSAWTLAPSHLGGIAWGGAGYFLEAATRYPNIGPVNGEVFFGILAVLGTCYLPVVIAWGYLAHWSKRTLYVFALLFIPGYLVVAVRLDWNLWLAAFYGNEQGSLVFLLFGPASHTLAAISVGILVAVLMFFPEHGSPDSTLRNVNNP